MSIAGYYYLHVNGELIYKVYLDGGQVADFRESDLVVAFWPVDPSDRAGAYTLLVEALAAGANRDRVMELAEKWGCLGDDAKVYAERIGVNLFVPLGGKGWQVTGQGMKVGHGETPIDALADLAKDIGWRPQKLWGSTFPERVRAQA